MTYIADCSYNYLSESLINFLSLKILKSLNKYFSYKESILDFLFIEKEKYKLINFLNFDSSTSIKSYNYTIPYLIDTIDITNLDNSSRVQFNNSYFYDKYKKQKKFFKYFNYDFTINDEYQAYLFNIHFNTDTQSFNPSKNVNCQIIFLIQKEEYNNCISKIYKISTIKPMVILPY